MAENQVLSDASINKMDLLDRLLGFIDSEKPGKLKWFTRLMGGLSPGDRQIMEREVLARGRELPHFYLHPKNRGAKQVGPKDHLTDEEATVLANNVWLRRKDLPGDSLPDLILKCQDFLPKEKQRKKFRENDLWPIKKKLIEIDQRLYGLSTSMKAKDPTQRQSVVSSLTDDELMIHYARFKDLITPSDMLDRMPPELVLERMATRDLLVEVMDRVMQGVSDMSALAEGNLTGIESGFKGLLDVMQTARPPAPTPKPVEQDRIIKISIVGLSGRESIIESRFRGRCKFAFYDNRQRAELPKSGLIILMTAFISHTVSETIEKQSGAEVVHCKGGMSSLIAIIETLLQRRKG